VSVMYILQNISVVRLTKASCRTVIRYGRNTFQDQKLLVLQPNQCHFPSIHHIASDLYKRQPLP